YPQVPRQRRAADAFAKDRLSARRSVSRQAEHVSPRQPYSPVALAPAAWANAGARPAYRGRRRVNSLRRGVSSSQRRAAADDARSVADAPLHSEDAPQSPVPRLEKSLRTVRKTRSVFSF